MEFSPYSLLKMLRNDRSFLTLLNRFFSISDIHSTLLSSENNKVSDTEVIISVNHNEIPLIILFAHWDKQTTCCTAVSTVCGNWYSRVYFGQPSDRTLQVSTRYKSVEPFVYELRVVLLEEIRNKYTKSTYSDW